nr:hypothetical protein B0A51_12756 [Rachicladosporium sp. CCFEE 5018]
MAPGAFLRRALESIPGSLATAVTLPIAQGGHEILLSASLLERIQVHELDLNFADMGLIDQEIPDDHPDKAKFLPLLLNEGCVFDLTICDGSVQRPHRQMIADYRQDLEPSRLLLMQLVLAMEHLKPGGTIIFRPHQIDQWETVKLLHQFSKFGKVMAHKPTSSHQVKSSFYVVVTERAATSICELEATAYFAEIDLDPELVLNEFGARLIELGEQVWRVQAEALGNANWLKKEAAQ